MFLIIKNRDIIKELTEEKVELNTKLDKLGKFIKGQVDGSSKVKISNTQFNLLRKQFNAMDMYSHMLYERIVDLQEGDK